MILYICAQNGNKKSKGACTNYIWEVGLWTQWHENGNKKSEGFYKGNNTLWTFRDESGGKFMSVNTSI